MLINPAFAGMQTYFASTRRGKMSDGAPIHLIPDCNRDQKLKAFLAVVFTILLLFRIRPNAVVTTGALPGLIVIAVAKRLGAHTIWIDSLANAEEMSLAGRRARKYADLWLSQWPQVANAEGAGYAGSVL